jgi:hypothetical protein
MKMRIVVDSTHLRRNMLPSIDQFSFIEKKMEYVT